MHDVLLFALLGVGTGAAYAVLAEGLVLIYKGSGVLNLAQGSLAMVAAYGYSELTSAGVSRYMATVLVLIGSAAAGTLIYLCIMRPLRRAPTLAKVVATLGIMITLQGTATLIWGTTAQFVPSLFPTSTVSVLGTQFGRDRLYLVAVTILFATGLWAIYRFTRFGLATRASAENEKGASLIGLSPDMIAASNWALGTALAGLAGILIAPISGLDPGRLTFLIVPALAAALLGGFSSFGLTAAVGLAIGSMQSLIGFYWTQPGVGDAVPFLLVMTAMVITGSLIPERGALSDGRPPKSPRSRVGIVPGLFCAGAVLLALGLLSRQYQSSLATAMIFAVIALSVVVIAGYVGQISLMQMAFTGIGAFAVSKLAVNVGMPFPLPLVLAAIIAIPCGVLLGLPALRVRGFSLAVVTFGAAVAVNSLLFQNPKWTGGLGGLSVPSPSIGGLSLDAYGHPVRFGAFVLFVLAAVSVGVSNVRRGGSGRRMFAVRGNERAAAASGVNVAATKLQAFALSASIAALGGALLAYQLGAVGFARFEPLQSITLLLSVYIAGIAVVNGALVAGIIASGGPLFVLLNQWGALDTYWVVASGVLLLVTVIANPDGMVVLWQQQGEVLRARFHSRFRRGHPPTSTTLDADEKPPDSETSCSDATAAPSRGGGGPNTART